MSLCLHVCLFLRREPLIRLWWNPIFYEACDWKSQNLGIYGHSCRSPLYFYKYINWMQIPAISYFRMVNRGNAQRLHNWLVTDVKATVGMKYMLNRLYVRHFIRGEFKKNIKCIQDDWSLKALQTSSDTPKCSTEACSGIVTLERSFQKVWSSPVRTSTPIPIASCWCVSHLPDTFPNPGFWWLQMIGFGWWFTFHSIEGCDLSCNVWVSLWEGLFLWHVLITVAWAVY